MLCGDVGTGHCHPIPSRPCSPRAMSTTPARCLSNHMHRRLKPVAPATVEIALHGPSCRPRWTSAPETRAQEVGPGQLQSCWTRRCTCVIQVRACICRRGCPPRHVRRLAAQLRCTPLFDFQNWGSRQASGPGIECTLTPDDRRDGHVTTADSCLTTGTIRRCEWKCEVRAPHL